MRRRKLAILWGTIAIAIGALCAGPTYVNGVEIVNSLSITESTSGTSVIPVGGITTIGDAVGASSHSLSANDDLQVTGKLEVEGYGYFDNLAVFSKNSNFIGRLLTGQGSDVASANDVILGTNSSGGTLYDVTGTTEVQRIHGLDWTAGSIVVLQFDASVQVTHGTAAGSGYLGFQLSGGANFSATAGDTLMLVYDGAWWREVSRTAI